MRKRVFLQGGILLHISFPYLVQTSRSSLSSHHVTRTNEIILLSCIFFRDFFSSLRFTELAALWISLNQKWAKNKVNFLQRSFNLCNCTLWILILPTVNGQTNINVLVHPLTFPALLEIDKKSPTKCQPWLRGFLRFPIWKLMILKTQNYSKSKMQKVIFWVLTYYEMFFKPRSTTYIAAAMFP